MSVAFVHPVALVAFAQSHACVGSGANTPVVFVVFVALPFVALLFGAFSKSVTFTHTT